MVINWFCNFNYAEINVAGVIVSGQNTQTHRCHRCGSCHCFTWTMNKHILCAEPCCHVANTSSSQMISVQPAVPTWNNWPNKVRMTFWRKQCSKSYLYLSFACFSYYIHIFYRAIQGNQHWCRPGERIYKEVFARGLEANEDRACYLGHQQWSASTFRLAPRILEISQHSLQTVKWFHWNAINTSQSPVCQSACITSKSTTENNPNFSEK